MFTGLVREVGRIRWLRRTSGVTVLDIHAPRLAPGLAVGDSLAVNGICFTATAVTVDNVRVDASPETRRVTTVSGWRVGERVHLEPALRTGDQVGGHFVLGHVDGVGRVTRITRQAGTIALSVSVPQALLLRLLPKGSIAVDGVSLTLDAGPFDRTFTVTLIPHTLHETRLGALRIGDHVNLELDVLSKSARGGAGKAPTAHGECRPTGSLTMSAILARGWTRI